MKFFTFSLLLFLLFPLNQLFAQINETTQALFHLNSMLAKIDCVKPYVEKTDLGRLRVLENSIENTKSAINEHGYSHRTTIQSYDLMMIKFDRSSLFLKSVETNSTKVCLKDLWEIHLNIVEKRGLPVASRMVFNIFDELKRRMDELSKANIPLELSDKISALFPEFGHVISIAQTQGDTPPTYEVATLLYHKITALYPDLNEISNSNEVFDLTVDIIGLSEFYREFAGLE